MNKYEYIYMDFEFGHASRRYISLVCVSILVEGKLNCYDLRDESGRLLFHKVLSDKILVLSDLGKIPVLVSYNIDAEIRSLFAIYKTSNIHELPFKHFICLQREHRMLANKFKDLTHGQVITETGKTTRKYIPSKSSTSLDFKFVNLMNALWKFLQVFKIEHLKYKNLYRDICIRQNLSELEINIKEIMNYCNMDTALLPQLHKAINDETIKRFKARRIPLDHLFVYQLRRGGYGAIIAEKTQQGYHIDVGRYFNILGRKQELVNEICRKINAKWPERKTFVFDQKFKRYVFKRDAVTKFVENEVPTAIKSQFPRTLKKREISVNKETLEKLYGDVKYNLDPNDYLQQIYQYIRTVSALSGLTRKSASQTGTKPFYAYFDQGEGVVRPYYNDFGSSTGRSQPAANGYLLAKPAWMRSLLVPPPENIMVAADFGKQEILYIACLAQDKALIDAYATGDPYVQFGLKARILDEREKGTPKWEIDRAACKQTVLAMMYGMGADSLALKLSTLYKRTVPPFHAKKYILAFERQYPEVARWKKNQVVKYQKQKYLMLKDGWMLWHNSYNKRSIINHEVQGGCGAVMREFEFQFRRRKQLVPMTLHDGFYVYFPLKDSQGIDFYQIAYMVRCLRDAFIWGLDGVYGSDLIDIDLKIIGPAVTINEQYPFIVVDKKEYPIEYQTHYVDKRAVNDLKEFGKYMDIQQTLNIPPPYVANING